MSHHVHYPPAIPTECIQEAFRIIREGRISEEMAAFGEHAWNVQGYLQSRILGSPHETPMQVFGASVEDLEVAQKHFEDAYSILAESLLVNGSADTYGASSAAIDPTTIVLIIEVVSLIVKLIKELRK